MTGAAPGIDATGQVRRAHWEVRLVPIVVAGLLAWGALVFWPSMAALAELWSNPERQTYQHGYLIAGIVAWLLFRRRNQLTQELQSPQPAWLVACGAASIAWSVAYQAGLQTMHMLLWPVATWLALSGLFGWRVGRLLAFPMAYLYFAMPLWDALAPVLQTVTVAANHFLTSLVGIPALIEGDVVHIPAGSFEISGRCSGLNYFVVGLALGSLLGEINGDRWSRRLLLVAFIALLALVSNWLRVFIVIAAGHLTNMQHYFVRVEHQNLGWALFALTLAAYLFVVRRFPRTEVVVRVRADLPDEAQECTGVPVATVLVALAIVALGPALAWSSASRETSGSLSITLPQTIEWKRVEADPRGWAPVFPGADGMLRADYVQGGERVSVFVAGFLRLTQSRKISGYGTDLVGPNGGALVGRVRRHLIGTDGRRIPITEREWSNGRSQAVLWLSYRVGNRDFASGLSAQLWYGLSSLWSSPVSTVIALRTDCLPDCDDARQALREFAKGNLQALRMAPSLQPIGPGTSG